MYDGWVRVASLEDVCFNPVQCSFIMATLAIERRKGCESKARASLTAFERLFLLCPADGSVAAKLGVS
jgi:hypothetical protein